MSRSAYKVTKKDITSTHLRYMSMSIAMFNYQTQNGPMVVYSFAPILRKLYPNDADYIEALNNHYKYFNSQSYMSSLILGAVLSMEEQLGLEGKDTIQDFKAGIMGPTAGIGDSVFFVILPGIFVPIAASMAYQGNIFGVAILLAWAIGIEIWRWNFFKYGYNMGTAVVTKLKDKIGTLTEACSILGLTVLGALITSVVKVTCPLTFTLSSGSVINIQNLLNSLLPNLLPVAFTALFAFLLAKKKATMLQLIFVVLVISIVGAAFKILG